MGDDEFDGGIYAEGTRVCVRPRKHERGITLGFILAEARNECQAAEIARRCAAYEPLLTAAKEALAALEKYSPNLVMDAKDALRVAIRQAEADGHG